MIRKYARRTDWYTVPFDWVYGNLTPGIQVLGDSKAAGVHLSHLPTIPQEEVRHFLTQRSQTVDLAARVAFDAKTEPNGFKLRAYQHEGREFIRNRRGTLLADQMRTGKTLTSLSTHDPDSGILVVVAPLATRTVWVDWIKRMWPDVDPLVLHGRKYNPHEIRDAKAVFVHYDILLSHQNLGLHKIGTLIFDEIHLLQNRRTKRGQAAFYLTSKAERVIGATGTPLWNKPLGLWSILTVLNPGAWGSYYEFVSRYSNPELTPYGTKFEGTANEGELKQRLTEIMIRREWQDVVDQLPASTRDVEIADLTEPQMHKIAVAAEKIRDYKRKSTVAGALGRFRRLLGKHKATLAVDVAERVLDGGEPVVVWTWHRDVADKIAVGIAKKGFLAFCLTGADSQDLRDRTIMEWKRHSIAALVLTIPIGQVGIDLSHARQAIFAEVDWTPAAVAQAEMRTFSPLRPMAITYLVVDHDIDRNIVRALQRKCEVANAIGVPASDTAIDVIADAFGMTGKADMDRLMAAFLASSDEE